MTTTGTTTPTEGTTTTATRSRRRPGPRSRAAAAGVVAAALVGALAASPATAATAPATSPPATSPAAAAASTPAAAPAAAEPGARTLDSADLVAHWYEDFLGRTLYAARADEGRRYWARQLGSGASKEAVLGELTRSQEYADTSVREVYVRLLGRLPDPGARYWTRGITEGMAVEWVEQNVLASPEYSNLEADEFWVRDVYAEVLGREASGGEARYWAGRFSDLGALGIVRAIWYSPEGVAERITSHYQQLLGRDANRAEVDSWRAAETRSDLATRIAFASSAEYATLDPEQDPDITADAVAVEGYLDDVAAGGWESAFARLSSQAQAAAGGFDAWYARRGELTQRLAPFASTPRRDYLASDVTEGSSAVVVPRGGAGVTDVVSFGVRVGVEGRMVDTGVRPVVLRLGPPDRELAIGEPVTLGVDRRGQAASTSVMIDGRFQDEPPFDTRSTGTRFTITPDPRLAPGRHVVTAIADTDTVLQVESAVVTVR